MLAARWPVHVEQWPIQRCECWKCWPIVHADVRTKENPTNGIGSTVAGRRFSQTKVCHRLWETYELPDLSVPVPGFLLPSKFHQFFNKLPSRLQHRPTEWGLLERQLLIVRTVWTLTIVRAIVSFEINKTLDRYWLLLFIDLSVSLENLRIFILKDILAL